MKKSLFAFVVFVIVCFGVIEAQVKPQPVDDNVIQLAVLLDVSNSMDGLINQAKSQLWKIVNEFSLARRSGKVPQIEVALYEYGKSSLEQSDGYIRQVVALTTDLDKISEELFALTTNGGDEYCGQVIGRAVKELKWSKSNNVLKVIFIAGNEPFNQGTVDYKKTCKEAIASGIIVNAIFCGNSAEGVETKWKDGADLADGSYSYIDQNQQVVYINAPQDNEIKRLGEELNKTYISYGSAGVEKKKRQEAQDKNAASLASEVAVQRSVAKASVQYKNESWDLVDAAEQDEKVLEKVKEEELPQEMKGMNAQQRKAYLEGQSKKRDDLQKKINTLNQERQKYVEQEQKKQATGGTLDKAIIGTVRKQAEKKNYEFGK